MYKDKDCNLQTKVYRKPTDRTSLLHKKSAHPSATKMSIIYSQALRIKRICSEEYEMRKQFSVLKEKLLVRGYESELIDENIKKTNTITREELLREKEQEVSNPKLPFITTFNKTLPNIREKIDSNWKTLNINQKVSKAFQAKITCSFPKKPKLSCPIKLVKTNDSISIASMFLFLAHHKLISTSIKLDMILTETRHSRLSRS